MTVEIPRGPLAHASAALFGAGSKLRGARVVHPQGVGFAGELRVERTLPGHAAVPLLRAGERRAVIARLSRSVGLPEPLPDLLGLTLRIEDGHGAGQDLDLALITSADGLGHFLLLPTLSGFLGRPFSSVMLYEIAGRKRLFGALPVTAPADVPGSRSVEQLLETAARDELRWQLAVAEPRGSFCPFGEISLRDRLPDEEVDSIAFNPATSGGGIRAVGPLMGIRGAAYAGSQRARGALEPGSYVKRAPHPQLSTNTPPPAKEEA